MTGPAASTSSPRASFASSFSSEEPARAVLRPLAPEDGWPDVPTEHLALISRGDFVTGRFARAARPKTKSRTPSPRAALLMAVHDAGGSAGSPPLGVAAGWIGPDLSLVAIDLPLHGHRSSPKLSERLIADLARQNHGDDIDRNGAVLVDEFWRQATIDLVRTLDAVLALGALDPKRIGLLGIGLGAALVDSLMELDDRPRAAVLVQPGASGPTSPRGSAAGAARPTKRAAAATTERLVLASDADPQSWIPAARAFLGARLG